MAKRLGRVATLEVSEDGATWKKVGRVVDATLNANRTEVDASDQDDLNTSWFRGRSDMSIDGTLRYDPADEGQEILEDSFFDDSADPNIKVRWRSRVGAGEKEYVADAFVSNWSLARPDEAPQDISFTIRLSGEPIRQGQQQNGNGEGEGE